MNRTHSRVMQAKGTMGATIASRTTISCHMAEETGYANDRGPWGILPVKNFTTQGPVQGNAGYGFGLSCNKTYQQMMQVAATDYRLRMGNNDFTIAFRVTLAAINVDSYLGGAQNGEWQLFFLGASSGKFRFRVTSSNGSTSTVDYASLIPSAGVEYSLICDYKRSPRMISLQVNGGAIETPANVPQTFPGDGVGIQSIAGIPTIGLGGVMRDWIETKGKLWGLGERNSYYNGLLGFATAADRQIKIRRPTTYHVYQRDGTDHANITIVGEYIGSPTGFQASYNGGSFTDISASFANGRFTGTLPNQTDPQGALVVRFTNDTSIASQVTAIGIGDVYAIGISQSNASGRTANFQVYSGSVFSAFFGLDWKFHVLADPMDAQLNGEDISLGIGTVTTGSVWPVVASNISASTGRPVCFVMLAKGGTSVAQWQPGATHTDRSTLYGGFVTRVLEAQSICGGVKGILSHLGETDSQLGTAQGTFASSYSTIASTLLSDTGLKIMPAKLQTLQYDHTAVNAAYASLWGTGSILAGPDFSPINVNIGGNDGLHFVVDSTVSAAASLWSTAILGGSW